jgi:hypothetical protein
MNESPPAILPEVMAEIERAIDDAIKGVRDGESRRAHGPHA